MNRRHGARWLALAGAMLWALGAAAQAPDARLTLKQAFEAAWERQPEAAAQAARRDAARAARDAAASWLAEPAALELAARTDRFNGNAGGREYEAGLALALWLPGERERAARLADAELGAHEARLVAAKLRTAAQVREAWWAWQRATLERDLARDRLAHAQQLATDVNRRVAAGDLARADQYQAEGAVAQAEAALAEATAAHGAAQQALRLQAGAVPLQPAPADAEAVPSASSFTDVLHPAWAELNARAEASRRAADLAAVQRRANPELMVGTTRERGQFDERYQDSITLGLRIPFGGGRRADAKVAGALADAQEAQVLAAQERTRLQAEIDVARSRVEVVRAQAAAADTRARLAKEVRGFYEKSFRLGESDLPTRLRIELEAVEAERQAARARIESAAAVSALRQALGLLPE